MPQKTHSNKKGYKVAGNILSQNHVESVIQNTGPFSSDLAKSRSSPDHGEYQGHDMATLWLTQGMAPFRALSLI